MIKNLKLDCLSAVPLHLQIERVLRRMLQQGIAVENFARAVSRERAGKVVGAGSDIDSMTLLWRLQRVRG